MTTTLPAMPLDAQLEPLLEVLNGFTARPRSELDPVELRAVYASFRFPRSRAELAGTEDRAIPGPGGDLPVRIYTPLGEPPFGVVVYFHGGGWVVGDLDMHDATCRSLTAASGCLLVSVDYRLAPEHPFPAAADDAYAAVEWVAAHARDVGGDPDRLAVAGDSAGGNLAAVAALRARDRGGPRLAFQLLLYPVVDHDFDRPSYHENAQGYMLTRADTIYFMTHYVPDVSQRDDPDVSPLRAADLSGLPPALVITAEYDPLRDEGEEYAARLRAAGVEVRAHRYDGMIHGFFTMERFLDAGGRAMAEAGDALRHALAAVHHHGGAVRRTHDGGAPVG